MQLLQAISLIYPAGKDHEFCFLRIIPDKFFIPFKFDHQSQERADLNCFFTVNEKILP
jgi:hypothetical protein